MFSAEYETDDSWAPSAGPRILLAISGFLVVSGSLAQFTPRTRNRAREEVSP